ncbi:transcriptional regulator [Nocardioides aromaticivorans]|uniref:Transcriptional regulator n=1 Tax=Nocardioides aromaticivorans TaxID=200618 RepID=A0ABX7PJL6_9ACTN|nr:transcriptional regulator [Nocardioides aromaticivorans]
MARVIVASLVSLGLVTGVGVALVYAHWNGNLTVKKVDDLVTDRPDRSGGEEVNILVMGDDTRAGKGNKIDGAGGGGSDTTILFHLSADREFAYGISIPRDTLVDRPECKREDGSVTPAKADAIWNEAYAVAGPSCTIQQFESLTDILVDNYVVVDFNGFKDMVDALDGVEVCIPEDIVDEDAGITLKAGTREIEGDEALSYVRVRKGVAGGDGTDPQRIKRQQAFMASMINEALRADMLARPDQLIGFINATTKSLTTDFENIGQMADLARSFQGIGLDNISFVTTPWVYSTAQEGRVELTDDVAKLWRLVRQDKELTRDFRDDSINAADDPDGSPSASGSASGTPEGSASASAGDPSTDATEEPVEEEPASPGLC